MGNALEERTLEEAWLRWKECLVGDDRNSIIRQIQNSVWDTAIFRVILEGRKRRNPSALSTPELNYEFHRFIDRNYFQAQGTFIRRQLDGRYPILGKQGIFSVKALLNDLKLFRNVLTREKYFELQKYPYDYSKMQKEQWDYVRRNSEKKEFVQIPREYDCEPAIELHAVFDHLSGSNPETRTPMDVILETSIINLDRKLDGCKEIKDYVTKNYAHAATPESREIDEIDKIELTLQKLWDAQKNLFEVADLLSYVIAYQSHMPLAIEGTHFFDNWDKPLFTSDELVGVRNALERYREETNQWQFKEVREILRNSAGK